MPFEMKLWRERQETSCIHVAYHSELGCAIIKTRLSSKKRLWTLSRITIQTTQSLYYNRRYFNALPLTYPDDFTPGYLPGSRCE